MRTSTRRARDRAKLSAVPTTDEQFKFEMRLERHLRNWRKLREKWDALDVGANDVPLDEHGFAIGTIPEHALPMDESVRFGGNGDDRVPWWLEGGRRIPNISSFRARPMQSSPIA